MTKKKSAPDAPADTSKMLTAIAGKMKVANADLAQFNDRVTKDPFYAFEWGDDALTAAATLKVLAEMRDGHRHEHQCGARPRPR